MTENVRLAYEPVRGRKAFVLQRNGRRIVRLDQREAKRLLRSVVEAMMARISTLPK